MKRKLFSELRPLQLTASHERKGNLISRGGTMFHSLIGHRSRWLSPVYVPVGQALNHLTNHLVFRAGRRGSKNCCRGCLAVPFPLKVCRVHYIVCYCSGESRARGQME